MNPAPSGRPKEAFVSKLVRLVIGTSVLALANGVTLSADAQMRLPKPVIVRPSDVLVPPSPLTAASALRRVILAWPPVAKAQGYRVTRLITTAGTNIQTVDPPTEVTIYEGPINAFDPGQPYCSAPASQPRCEYVDLKVQVGLTYIYRVWTVYPGPVVSPPSPPTTVKAQ
jgi:hypothetical protein